MDRRGWIWIGVLGLLAVGAGVLGAVLLRRHDDAVSRRALQLHERELQARRVLQRQRVAARLARDYLQLETMQWDRRDRTLALIERTADGALKSWAVAERRQIAPYLKRWNIVQRYNAAANQLELRQRAPTGALHSALHSGSSPEGLDTGLSGDRSAPSAVEAPPAAAPGPPPADEADAEATVRSPRWRAYFKVRETLRHATGQYCCRISTGKVLFSRASTVQRCRAQAQTLCNVLSSTVSSPQQCTYTLTTACDGGDVIAVGDVTGEVGTRSGARKM